LTDETPQAMRDPQVPPQPVRARRLRGRRPSRGVIAVVALTLAVLLGVIVVYGLGLGPFAPAAPASPAETLAPGTTAGPPTATSGPDATPDGGPPSSASAMPSIGPAATASPTTDTERLLLHVPEAIRADCVAVAGVPPILATATCSVEAGQITLTYLLYSSLGEMRTAYDGYVAAAQIEPNTGSCGLPGTWPAEGEYKLGETVAGRLLCMDVTDEATVYWTDERLSILALATDAANDRERLWRFWLDESGPML